MNANKLLSLLGDPGRHAWIVFTLATLNYFPVAFNHLIMSIYGARPPHRCSLPDGHFTNTSIPEKEDGQLDSCNVWVNYTSATNQTEYCPNGWQYKLEEGESTIVNEVGIKK